MPKVYLTYAQELEDKTYTAIDRAMALQNITQTDAGAAIGISQAGFSQAYKGRTLSFEQMCNLLSHVGLTLCVSARV